MDAIYTRQSLDKKDSLSIDGQIAQCEKYIKGKYIIYKDKGYSGKNTHRPAFEQMMTDVEAGKISKIYVYKLDRFSRSTSDFGQVWTFLDKHNVEFESVTEKFDTSTPIGRAMINIVLVFAQLERETIAERVKDNYYHRVDHGSWPGGPAPIGFDIEHIFDSQGRRVPTLSPNEKMDLVKDIFGEYARDGASLGSIAKRLNHEGIPSIKRQNWDNVTLSRILRSPLYVMADEDVYLYYLAKGLNISQEISEFTGEYACNIIGKRNRTANKYNDLKDQKLSLSNHYGVVSSQIWLKCQYKLDNNRQISLKSAGKHSWLTGLMKCSVCGYSIKINKIDGKFYLICSGRSNLKLCTESVRLDLRELEKEVEKHIIEQLAQLPNIETSVSGNDAAVIAEIDLKIERLISALSESSDVTAKYIDRELARLDRQKQEISDAQKKSQQTPSPAILQSIKFNKLSMEEKKVIASTLIDKILLKNETAEIIWKV